MHFASAISFQPRAEAPRLSAGEVALRGHVLADFDAFWAFFQTDRAAYVGTPKTPTHLWYGLGSEIASWQMRGIGGWAVELNGALAGQVAIMQPPHFPEVEIGWTLFDGFEGRNIGFRAARLALDWFWSTTDHPSLVSYITPENARSIALAERLGASHDPLAILPADETPAETIVYRHRRPA
ncbi:GNAT family N-acetyltransferase [Primorskyibacter sp. S187A]|uniref:GNAT family N-acetyltransferase n=1 Tax=Primorskyibacter sp. S187A TaxID=3415130 RepID=UPI003C7E312B